MAWIALEGMRFFAYHGVYDAEQVLGGEYVLDVYIKTGISLAAGTDALENAVNYETVHQICKLEMSKPRKLIEKVLQEIVNQLKHQFGAMQALRVRVRKLNPPLGGRVASAVVEEEYDFYQECPRCKSMFINYEPDDCWKRHPNAHPATRETLERQFGKKCLCDNCLKLYAG